MSEWLRRLLNLPPRFVRPTGNSREADWMARSAVPTEADEAARLRDEEVLPLPPTAGGAPAALPGASLTAAHAAEGRGTPSTRETHTP